MSPENIESETDEELDDLSYSGEDESEPSASTGRGKKRKKSRKKKSAELQGVELIRKKVGLEKRVNTGLCIICQKIKKVAPTGTEKGRKTLLEFAKEKNDDVYE